MILDVDPLTPDDVDGIATGGFLALAVLCLVIVIVCSTDAVTRMVRALSQRIRSFTMRRFVFLLAVILFPSFAFAQTPVAGALDSIAWDYTQAQINASAVDHFVVCLDATPCITLTLAQAKHPTLGMNVYFWKLPAMVAGAHSMSIVACNLDLCSAQLVLTFRFALQPDPVANGRIIKGE